MYRILLAVLYQVHAIGIYDGLGSLAQESYPLLSNGCGIAPRHDYRAPAGAVVPPAQDIPDSVPNSAGHSRAGVDAGRYFQHHRRQESAVPRLNVDCDDYGHSAPHKLSSDGAADPSSGGVTSWKSILMRSIILGITRSVRSISPAVRRVCLSISSVGSSITDFAALNAA